ncbi:MAG TPA: peptidase S41 [Nitrospina sp.]|jgi:carboxyl-terminal processing protease|nr:S41 family peptidase [Nitrospinaceae bacterium]HAX46200.1 peptidase S41 [Nitrospina sp.]|tara:strand:- start:1000 stop:2580 length:1581 start_codon:yes stop_codon:yes gene_type:complete
MMNPFSSRKIAALLTATLLGLFLLFPAGGGKPVSALLSTAEAGFFSNDLELFEEVVDLVGDKYVYPPDYKKMFMASIDEMVRTLDDENIITTDNPGGQTISRFDSSIHYQLNFNREHDLEAFKKIYYFLHEESKSKLSKEELETAAVTGLMNSLDPYSQYMDAEVFGKSMRDTEGKYGGLGMVITMKDSRLYVVKTMKNSPAQRAGILPDDIFEKCNGEDISKTQISELADMLRGYPDTKVTISLHRQSDKRERTYTLTREIISIETVEYETLEDNIGSIKITSFSKQTNDQLKEALAKSKQDKVRGFILDLRDNPGGLLDQSVKVSSHFLYRNRLVVYTQGRESTDHNEYRAQYKNSLHFMPVIILINEYSASAAEIVAGALRDSGKALIIGENSYGKGTVQTIFRTSDGSGLRLTTSKYYTPSGTDITAHGIIPEIRIIQDYIPEEGSQAEEKSKIESPQFDSGSLIKLKESEVKNYIQKKNYTTEESADPTFQFAKMVIKNVAVANKKKTLEKARELAANIHY